MILKKIGKYEQMFSESHKYEISQKSVRCVYSIPAGHTKATVASGNRFEKAPKSNWVWGWESRPKTFWINCTSF